MKARLLSDVYSATGQRHRLGDEEHAWTMDDFLAQLRVDSLLSRTIIIPDTHLLDGGYFLRTDPVDLEKRIGRGIDNKQLPIEIRTRSETLEESLAHLLDRSGTDTFNAFPFNTIRDRFVRHRLALHLETLKQEVLREHLRRADSVPSALSGFLREQLQRVDANADEDLEQMEEGWSKWIAAEKKGHVTCIRWDRPLSLADALNRDAIDPDEDLLTAAGRDMHREIIQAVRHGSTYRSQVTSYAYVYEFNKESLTPSEALDLRTLELWYNQARHRAFALQHAADQYVHAEDQFVTPVGPLRRHVKRIAENELAPSAAEVTVPELFLLRLAAMSNDTFARMAMETRAMLESWWDTGDRDALRCAIDVLLQEMKYWETPSGQLSVGLVRVFGGVVATGLVTALGTMAIPAAGVVGWIATRTADGVVRKDVSRQVVEYLLDEATSHYT